MARRLPPVVITGAEVLTGTGLTRDAIGIAHEQFVRAAADTVDLSGYLVLPGIVDLCARVAEGATVTRAGLQALDTSAAAAGITTSWVSVDIARHGLEVAARLLSTWRGLQPTLTDLRIRLDVSVGHAEHSDALSHLIEDHGVGYASVSAEPVAPGGGRLGLPENFRRIARLAELFDRLGVFWTAYGCADVDSWERFRMLGARACEAPGSRAVAAAAVSMDCPVVPGATDTGAKALIRERFCSACASSGHPAALAALPWELADRSDMSFATAWSLISTAPARLIGMRDRDRIATGQRADFVVVNKATRAVELTVAGGALVHASGEAANRIARVSGSGAIAAE